MAMLASPLRGAAITPLSFKKKPLDAVVSSIRASKTIVEQIGEVAAHNQLYDVKSLGPTQFKDNIVNLNSFRGPDGTDKSDDDRKRLDAWLSSYASFNDGHAPERVANLVDEFGHPTGKTAKVNLMIVTNLLPGDSWGIGETRAKYIEDLAASYGSRGKPYLSLAHSNESTILDSDAWGPHLSTERKLLGHVDSSRPPSLADLAIRHHKCLSTGLYTGEATVLDLEGWSMYYREGKGQTMYDIASLLNQWYVEDRVLSEEIFGPPKAVENLEAIPMLQDVVEDPKTIPMSKEDSRQIVTNKFGNSEVGVPRGYLEILSKLEDSRETTLCTDFKYQRWLEFPTYNFVEPTPSELQRYEFEWRTHYLASDDDRYTYWLLTRDEENTERLKDRIYPEVVVDYEKVHPRRLAAVRSLEYHYKVGKMKGKVFDHALRNIYKNSGQLWDAAQIENLQTMLDNVVHPMMLHESAPLTPIDHPVSNSSFVPKIVVDGRGFESAGKFNSHPDRVVEAANDSSFTGIDHSYTHVVKPFKLNWVARKEKVVSKDPDPNDHVLRDSTLGFVKIIGGIMVADHIEEVRVTDVYHPPVDAMFEDMVYDSKREMYVPIKAMTLGGALLSGIHKVYNEVGS